MRMWMVDPRGMCRKHLLGEHVETHMLLGSMNKGISMDGYVRNNLAEPAKLAARHDALATEMKRRGYRHQSPLSHQDAAEVLEYYSEGVQRAKVHRAASLAELVRRCPECAKVLNKG